jgi:hypothetical protein
MKYLYSLVILIFFLCVTCLIIHAQSITKYILIDQFGYLPESDKIAVIRDPQTGYDSEESFTPGTDYALVNRLTGEHVITGSVEEWNSGAEDASSGDRVWWFDFSSCTQQGEYYVLDITNNKRSYSFWISYGVYNEILKQAVRSFFYQRAGFEKQEQYAGEGWADGASHLGPLQDANCRIFNDPDNAETERDLHGGWYDAGDYNKYTSWTANYIVEMMKAFIENPDAWTDNYNIPESGNGMPDLLDEAKWGIDLLLRLQNENGSALCIVDLSHASPPSSATGPSLYGPETTSATLNTAAAFALSSMVFRDLDSVTYADTLQQRAIKAWDWANANPAVLFRNNDPAYGSEGIGAGQQEESDYQRLMSKLEAACFLFGATGNTEYRDYFDANYQDAHLMQWNLAYPFETANQEALLFYSTLNGATPAVSSNILTVYKYAMIDGNENFPAYSAHTDPYLAHIKDYSWGSNSIKAGQGNMFYNMISFHVDDQMEMESFQAATHYLHYLHGVNPLDIVYLSNMYRVGGDNCVNEFYHSWFTDGSPLWDRYGVSVYGPAPGFLTGGPNPSYDWDGCCPGSCGSTDNNAMCTSESITPPKDQPDQKSYKDFNTSWPLNSWSVTENSCGYQVNYIRLLSKYVNPEYDCSGEKNGTAFYDVCGNCSGGNTGIEPETDPVNCPSNSLNLSHVTYPAFQLFPNPTRDRIKIITSFSSIYIVKIIDITGQIKIIKDCLGNVTINCTGILQPGCYEILFIYDNQFLLRHLTIF